MGQVMAIPRRDLCLNIPISSKSNPWAAILFKLFIAGKEKYPVKKWWFLTQLVHRMVRQTLSEHDGWWEDKSRKQCSSTLCFSLESQTGQSTEKNYLLSTKTKAKLKQMQAIVSWSLGNGYHSKNKLKTGQAKTSLGMFLIPALSGQQKPFTCSCKNSYVLGYKTRDCEAEWKEMMILSPLSKTGLCRMVV